MARRGVGFRPGRAWPVYSRFMKPPGAVRDLPAFREKSSRKNTSFTLRHPHPAPARPGQTHGLDEERPVDTCKQPSSVKTDLPSVYTLKGVDFPSPSLTEPSGDPVANQVRVVTLLAPRLVSRLGTDETAASCSSSRRWRSKGSEKYRAAKEARDKREREPSTRPSAAEGDRRGRKRERACNICKFPFRVMRWISAVELTPRPPPSLQPLAVPFSPGPLRPTLRAHYVTLILHLSLVAPIHYPVWLICIHVQCNARPVRRCSNRALAKGPPGGALPGRAPPTSGIISESVNGGKLARATPRHAELRGAAAVLASRGKNLKKFPPPPLSFSHPFYQTCTPQPPLPPHSTWKSHLK